MNKKNKQEEEQRYKAPRMQVFGLSVHSCIAASIGNTEGFSEETGSWGSLSADGSTESFGETTGTWE